jgi:glucokinase
VSGPHAIGIDLGATHVKTVVVALSGERLAEGRFETGDANGAWRERIRRHVASVERDRGQAEWIGIAAPGLAAPDGRAISWMQGRLADVQGLDWTAHLGRERIVPVLNDAHAALLGELWRGAAIGARNAVLLTLGTGVGGAIVCDGRLLRGRLGRAGHLGHLSLCPDGPRDIVNTPGSLEDAIGDHTVHARTNGRFASTAALVRGHLAGDDDASRAWLRSVKALAAAVASIINAVDPEVFLIGGGIAQAGPALFDPLSRFLDDDEWRPHGARVRVVPTVLGDLAGALGAARNAMQWDSRKEGE